MCFWLSAEGVTHGQVAVGAEVGHVHGPEACQAERRCRGVWPHHSGTLAQDDLTGSNVSWGHNIASNLGWCLDNEGVTIGLWSVDQKMVLKMEFKHLPAWMILGLPYCRKICHYNIHISMKRQSHRRNIDRMLTPQPQVSDQSLPLHSWVTSHFYFPEIVIWSDKHKWNGK